jgi:hypothetical protein
VGDDAEPKSKSDDAEAKPEEKSDV